MGFDALLYINEAHFNFIKKNSDSHNGGCYTSRYTIICNTECAYIYICVYTSDSMNQNSYLFFWTLIYLSACIMRQLRENNLRR